MDSIGYSLVTKGLLGACGVGAALASGSVAETFYVSAILGGKTVIPSLTVVFALPFAMMMAIAGSGACAGAYILSEDGYLTLRIAVSVILASIGVAVTSDIVGSDEYFMYDNDGSRAIYANKMLSVTIALVALLGV